MFMGSSLRGWFSVVMFAFIKNWNKGEAVNFELLLYEASLFVPEFGFVEPAVVGISCWRKGSYLECTAVDFVFHCTYSMVTERIPCKL